MCGIAGLFAYRRRSAEPSLDELRRISERQRTRGPDDHGVWRSPDRLCAFDHRRLAIIDPTPAGHQPMQLAEGGHCITFNGEIYNYRELRAELEEKGEVFFSGSDTEVLLRLYRLHGKDMLSRLRGMYAFAIWDGERRGIFAARDPLGIKPFYYSTSGDMFRFASQARALVGGGGVSTAVRPGAQAGFLIWGSVPEPLTWWADVLALPAGHWLWVADGVCGRPQRHFDIETHFLPAHGGPVASVNDILAESVERHLVADVPVGIFLSSGLDSVALASLSSAQAVGRMRSLTVAFEGRTKGAHLDETEPAARIARRLGMQHTTVRFEAGDFAAHRAQILDAMDQPTIDGTNVYFVSMAASRIGLKVALSGVGGDELLGGYPSFSQIPEMVRRLGWLRPWRGASRYLRIAVAPAVSQVTSPKYASLLEYGTDIADAYLLRRSLFLPWELDRVLGRERAAFALDDLEHDLAPASPPPTSAHAMVSLLETRQYMTNQLLRDTDWAGMRHGVEVRLPFVDSTVISKLGPQIASETPPRKAALEACMDSETWREIRALPKRGFEVPMSDWLRSSNSPRARMRGMRGWALEVMDHFLAA